MVCIAALGMGTDLKPVAGTSRHVIAAVRLSLAVLGAMGVALIRALGVA